MARKQKTTVINSPNEPYWEKVLYDELRHSSDRAAAIVGASILEEFLTLMIEIYLVPEVTDESKFDPESECYPNTPDSLLGRSKPLNSFCAKIDMCYRLGLIGYRSRHDLHVIRDIRNDFAHNLRECNFEEESIKHKVENLVKSHDLENRMPYLMDKVFDSSRGRFVEIVRLIGIYLEGELNTIEGSLGWPAEESLYTSEFSDMMNSIEN